MPDPDKTVIYNPPPKNDGGGGWIVAIVILIAVILFLIFGLPRIRQGTNINVPEKIEVDVSP